MRMSRILPLLGLLGGLWGLAQFALAADTGGLHGVAESGLLWQVTGADGQVSHVFGTMHSADPAVTTLAAPVEGAFDAAERVILELDMSPATLLESARLMMYQDGGGLSKDIPVDLLREVNALAVDKGWPPRVLEQLRPWAVAVSLGAPPHAEGLTLDAKLAAEARARHKSVFGLETVAEQMRTFTSLSVDEQITLLRDVVDESAKLPAFFAELKQAYLAGDLDQILELGRQDLDKPDAELARRLLQGLLVDRNRLMVERMQGYLQQGHSFIAVGALHLPGGDGILQGLRARGYRVEAVH